MKKLLALTLTLLMLISVVGCSEDSDGSRSKRKDDSNSTSSQKCKTCNGEGKIECEKCDGKGYFPTEYGYRMLCSDCWEGYSDCPDCEEKEPETSPVSPNNPISPNNPVSPITPSPKNCVRCNNTGRITCTFCNGAGGWDETKYSSDYTGNGGTPYTVHQTCRTCGGNKTIDCPYC